MKSLIKNNNGADYIRLLKCSNYYTRTFLAAGWMVGKSSQALFRLLVCSSEYEYILFYTKMTSWAKFCQLWTYVSHVFTKCFAYSFSSKSFCMNSFSCYQYFAENILVQYWQYSFSNAIWKIVYCCTWKYTLSDIRLSNILPFYVKVFPFYFM